MSGLPFQNFPKIFAIAPTQFAGLSAIETQQAQDLQRLIEEHRHGIERELGCPFEFTTDASVTGAKWLLGPWRCNPAIQALKEDTATGPEITLDRKKGLLILDGTTPDEVMQTLSFLRSLGRFKDGTTPVTDCATTDEAIDRIYEEVRCSYPAFKLRNLDWDALKAEHIDAIKNAADPIPEMQKWVAKLQDGHTWVRPTSPYGQFPYDLLYEDGIPKFYRIGKNSEAWKLGVRPGFELLTNEIENWWPRTGATKHSKPFTVGFRYLATPMDEKKIFKARSPEGKLIHWEEEPTQDRWSPLVTRKKLPSGNGYLKISLFLLDRNIEQDIDEAFEEFKDCKKLIVDLRGNPGGNILMAHRIRNGFLNQDGQVGWIHTTLPDGTLPEKEPIMATIDPKAQRWQKPVIFLTDPLTYSASEDMLLGVQGQPNVKVIGQASGGGSGRVRLIPLLKGYRLTISTALTYDMQGNCIEGGGIPVDETYPISFDENSLIEIADRR